MRRTAGLAITRFAINDPVTRICEELRGLQGTVLRWKVLDFPHAEAQQIAADDGAISASNNQRHFLGELLRNCSFFAHLVLRAVREENNPFDRLSDRNPGCKKSSVLSASPALPRSSRNVLPKRRPLEALAPQGEEVRSFPQALWVEVGCRHARTIVFGKVPHDYGENSNAAL
jgi:hypothetical protein